MNMNAVELGNGHQAAPESVETPVIVEFEPRQQLMPARQLDARLAYGALVGIVLVTGWLTFSMNNSLDQINAQFERIGALPVVQPSQ